MFGKGDCYLQWQKEFIKDLDYIIIRILSEWKRNNGLGNGYDFSKRMEINDDDLILQRLKLMKER